MLHSYNNERDNNCSCNDSTTVSYCCNTVVGIHSSSGRYDSGSTHNIVEAV